MKTKLTVEQAAKKVIYALVRSGFNRDQAVEIFNGLYHGEQWNEFDLGMAIYEAFDPTSVSHARSMAKALEPKV